MMQSKQNGMSKLKILLALEESSKSLEGGKKSNIRNSFPNEEQDEAIPGKTEDDMRKLPLIYGGGKPGNTAHKMLSIEVDKLKTFCQ